MFIHSVPNWYIEVLEFIKRKEMIELSTTNWTFLLFCWPKLHGNVQPHKVDNLQFIGRLNEHNIHEAKLLKFGRSGRLLNEGYNIFEAEWLARIGIPIACTPPPEYITGFGKIYIE